MKPTLFILAAGMGSRYGGLKQLDAVGPSGETIMDYSVFDAIRAGFGKIVFVIRHTFEKEFREKVISKYQDKIAVEIVFQELSDLPAGFTLNPEREKPWGTGHALLMGEKVIKEPFAIINADDFYGKESYELLANFLTGVVGKKGSYCMIGYLLGNTLSDSGSVARGVCERNTEGLLTKVVERTEIVKTPEGPEYKDGDKWVKLTNDTPVSMNMWGFTPDYFELTKHDFAAFLKENQDKLKAEFLIPSEVNNLVEDGKVTVKVIPTVSDWFGVTYATDKPLVVNKINELVKAGVYPKKLF